jgi:UDP-3-O-[3-hydroxymyristoyl] glucosamine N-acyltransferase
LDLVITTGQLAEQLGAQLIGPADLALTRLDTIDAASAGAITFIRDEAFADKWAASSSSAALVSAGITIEGHDPKSRALIVVPDADLALIRLLELLASAQAKPDTGIAEHALVHPSATVAQSASIAPGAFIGENAHVGESTVIRANAVIERDARVGAHCEIHACVVVGRDCVVGDGCIIHAGTSIGSDGFGYRPAADGKGLVKIPHVGNVVIGQAVEIGANTCIDRAKFGSTTIGDGTKIDNLVQIAHNCVIGRACVLCGKAALSGSVTLGDGVVLGGSVNIIDNVTVGEGARLTAGAGVMNNIGPGETWMGAPAMPHRQQVRIVNALRRIGRGQPPKPGRNLER